MTRIDITAAELTATDRQIAADARQEYLALFSTAAEAVEFENQCLSIGRALLPPAAREVLDGRTGQSDYWAWLSDQVESARS